MIIDTTGCGEELQLSPAYANGFAWTIVYEISPGVFEFAEEGMYTTAEKAFTRMSELSATGEWSELSIVAVRAFSPVGINATE